MMSDMDKSQQMDDSMQIAADLADVLERCGYVVSTRCDDGAFIGLAVSSPSSASPVILCRVLPSVHEQGSLFHLYLFEDKTHDDFSNYNGDALSNPSSIGSCKSLGLIRNIESTVSLISLFIPKPS